MLKYLIVFIIIVDIYTLVDCAITPQEKVRRFPKWAWLLIIVLTGIFGDIAWFIAGRPRKPGQNRECTWRCLKIVVIKDRSLEIMVNHCNLQHF